MLWGGGACCLLTVGWWRINNPVGRRSSTYRRMRVQVVVGVVLVLAGIAADTLAG